VLWAALIFIGSSDLLSASHTSTFLIRPLHALFPSASEGTLRAIHFSIRKLGHLTEYAILATLAARALRSSSVRLLRQHWFLISLLFVVGYAVGDEFHQSFFATRTPSLYDSLIDSVGGLLGLAIVWWWSQRRVASLEH
jgi:VanZ family protein